jgi:predicted aldo/keto reductase-like oxidoreductase
MGDLFNIPKLGFGFMRLPGNSNEIDHDRLNGMVDEFIKNGYTYFDTAYVYHGGKSEKAIKSAVVKRYPRNIFTIADKLPAWELKSKDDLQRIFDEQLLRTGVDFFDFYLLHSIEEAHLKTYDKYDCWQWAQKLKEQGFIRHFGYSFHDTPELLDKALTEHPEVDFVQLQINYIDWENKIVHSGGCYDVARKHNKPIIIMEPVKGGMLSSMRPELEKKLKAAAPRQSIASWAIRYCLSLEGIAVILSGMSTEEQVADNIATFKNFAPFSQQEKNCLDEVIKEYLSTPIIGCTSCKYCVEGCPAKINIPGIISAYNTILTYGDHMRPHFYYGAITGSSGKAGSCTKCSQCESVCPQHLQITEVLEKASDVFDKRK